ncbi:hypothetical protein [Belnapia moabensis]|uniref:hypothetical protein n=1 Tax=Belnapia moabensis TaxID=365533 RepID=UPI0005BA123C|nr:hypothetical protein [Belnapia moabensis]
MEELITTVHDRDVADFLKEAFICYGTGAHRACVVLTHIALFDSLRRKIKAIAPVNGTAKAVSDEIEALAAAQRVFETPLIQKLKAAGILTHLEAQILEQLNSQRNKAAHPSGHTVTAEEARFVFAEAVKKFISQPVRETSYIVEAVIGRFGDQNFFPSSNVPDMVAVLGQELANLDPAAKPFLISRVVQSLDNADATIAGNARNFLLAFVARRETADRDLIIKGLVIPKSSDTKLAELFSMLVASDPFLFSSLPLAIKLRIRSLLMLNATAVGVGLPYQQLRHPARVLGACVSELGEAFVVAELKEFSDWVVALAPYTPELLQTLAHAPDLFSRLFENYVTRAASSQWATSNPFAAAVPALDVPLAALITDEQAFQLLAAIKRGAEWSGHGPLALTNSAFATLPALKAKAQSFAAVDPARATAVLAAQKVVTDLAEFLSEHLA